MYFENLRKNDDLTLLNQSLNPTSYLNSEFRIVELKMKDFISM